MRLMEAQTLLVATLTVAISITVAPASAGQLSVGAALVDVTPLQLPVLVNGSMLGRSVDTVKTPVSARAMVLDDGRQRMAIVVVDSCMMGRPFLDEVKSLASQRTSIRPDRILISATHTHSAPSCFGALGTAADLSYIPYLREKLAQSIAVAEKNLAPARVGWAVANAADFTAVRRWIRRPDRVAEDPFGNPTVRANMHAGRNWDDVTGESGPEDPDLTMISFQSPTGRPIAVLTNFSMHYFSGERGLSADYFGLFCEGMKQRLENNPSEDHPPFVAAMSHGCSGDIWRRDYKVPADERPDPTIEQFASGLLDIAMKAYDGIEYRDDAELVMDEARMVLNYRVPDQQRLEWARRVVEQMGDRPPKDRPEVYAREQIILDQRQSTEVVVQAVRIGDIGIVTTPNETYALTGLKLKLQSPLSKTMVIELANGGDGYIPPPEQHFLGGYNTWPARSAGLEVQAEPKITAAGLGLLEKVANAPRRTYRQSRGPAAKALFEARPVAYWRLDEFSGPHAVDSSGQQHHAVYEMGVVFFLEGPESESLCRGTETNRAAHFAGGRLRARVADLDTRYSIATWFWNGMPSDARKISGWMFSRGPANNLGPVGDHLGVGGATHTGKLIYLSGRRGEKASDLVAGSTQIQRWTWNHVVFVRNGSTVTVYLNGRSEPEIVIDSAAKNESLRDELFFGGRCDNQSNWEGRLDEITLFDRALTSQEVVQLFKSY